ncbi:hypothetical protein [Ferrovibrio sp.]|uniref:hypothetical protein n=1 Tax=Ferrovibrio sp. TaxID=1917215 RepID=UPI003D14B343
MTPDTMALFAAIVMLLPLGYLFLASPAFLFVRLSIPVVTRLLRIMFNGYFLVVVVVGALAAAVHASTAHLASALGLALIASFAFFARRWFLRQLDNAITARDAGDNNAVPYMRRLHVGGMAVNAVQLFAVIGGVRELLQSLV